MWLERIKGLKPGNSYIRVHLVKLDSKRILQHIPIWHFQLLIKVMVLPPFYFGLLRLGEIHQVASCRQSASGPLATPDFMDGSIRYRGKDRAQLLLPWATFIRPLTLLASIQAYFHNHPLSPGS